VAHRSIFRDGLFEEQTLLVTGGGSGIGRRIAVELAGLGAHVVLVGRDLDKLEQTRAELGEGRATAVACNIRREDDIGALFERVRMERGALHGLVNNAGGQYAAPAATIERKGFEAVVETNLTGTWLMCRAAFRSFFESSGGAIVNMLADMFRGMPMMAHSGAARAGVDNLTKTLALEWAGAHVRVNAVAPGVIASSGLDRYPPEVQEALRRLPAELPMARLGTEAEVASAVVFLLSEGARYITGATLRVDGGSSLYRHPFTLPPSEPSPAHGDDD
jgi:citronellol/citronellal dehydrogenase